MSFIIHGLRGFFRKGRSSITFIMLTFFVALAIALSFLVISACDIYKRKTENPYSDYYRLIATTVVENSPYETGIKNRDQMLSTSNKNIELINSYFRDITDYTMEISRYSYTSLKQYCPEYAKLSKQLCLYGITDCLELSEFAKGELSLISGRHIQRSDRERGLRVCMISREVAELNGVTVGDTVEVSFNNGESDQFYEIVGIYQINTSVINRGSTRTAHQLPENRMFVSLTAYGDSSRWTVYNYQIKLSDDGLADDIEELINRYSLGGTKGFLIKVSDIYGAENNGIHSLENAFSIVQYAFIVIAAALMFIFVYSLIRSRGRDIGVMLALGKSRAYVAAALFSELFLSFVIGISLAIAVAACYGADISSALLSSALSGSTVEALAITTSESILEAENSFSSFVALLDGTFLENSLFSAFFTVLSVFSVSFVFASVGILRIDVMRLMTRKGE